MENLQEEIPTEVLHYILKSKYDYYEILRLYGRTEEEIEQEKERIMNFKNPAIYLFTEQSFFYYITYQQLLQRKELDTDKIFHVASGSIVTENSVIRNFDIGYKGSKTLRYNNGWRDRYGKLVPINKEL